MPAEELDRYIKTPCGLYALLFIRHSEGPRLDGLLPYLDPDVIEYLSIPASEKIKDGVGRYILRTQLGSLLLPETVWRKKDPIETGSGFKALYRLLEELARRVEVDISVVGAVKYLYALFRRRGLYLSQRNTTSLSNLRL